jgi:CRISPR/Cas system-associated exonuclease Cas4 (RecB family)
MRDKTPHHPRAEAPTDGTSLRSSEIRGQPCEATARCRVRACLGPGWGGAVFPGYNPGGSSSSPPLTVFPIPPPHRSPPCKLREGTQQHYGLKNSTIGVSSPVSKLNCGEAKDAALYGTIHDLLSETQRQALQGIKAAEFPVQVEETLVEEKNTYLLAGTIDLLLNGSRGLEILDFKTLHRPDERSAQLVSYKRQLYFYAYATEKCFRQPPQRLFLYWTAEERKENALMEIPYCEDDVQQTMCAISETVAKIQQQQFVVSQPPSPHVCKTCDVRHLCQKERLIL